MTLYILYSGSEAIDSNFVYLTGRSNLDEISVLYDGKEYDINEIDILTHKKIYTLSNYVENKKLRRILGDKKIKIIDKYIEKARRIKILDEMRDIRYVTEYTCKAINKVLTKMDRYEYEYQVVDAIKKELKKYDICKEAFPPICVNGRNNVELHYSRNDAKLENGNLMILDIGFCYNNYCCDVGRTIPIGGKLDVNQKVLYDMIVKISNYAIKSVKVGLRFKEWERKVFKKYMEYLYDLGLINKLDINLVKLFMPHHIGHSIGIDVHDIAFPIFKNNVVFTIEPGIYFNEYLYDNRYINREMVEKYYYIGGIRIEDTAMIENSRVIVLSKKLISP
jgi:Xaa-Pro aminopeptidase